MPKPVMVIEYRLEIFSHANTGYAWREDGFATLDIERAMAYAEQERSYGTQCRIVELTHDWARNDGDQLMPIRRVVKVYD